MATAKHNATTSHVQPSQARCPNVDIAVELRNDGGPLLGAVEAAAI
jgi:hypothetical protein